MPLNPRMPLLFYTMILFTSLYPVVSVYAESNGMTLLKHRCASCHNLTGPAPRTLAELRSRKGPDMFYAGDKYRRKWLESWLQHPVRIRPAGMFYRQHIKQGEKRDIVDSSTLKPHVALNKTDAEAVALSLAKLKVNSTLANREKPDTVKQPERQGEMLFKNRYGCISCHQIKPAYGGLSGPELYTAGTRLQPGFMRSYIKSPQAWDPKIWMPDQHVLPVNIQKLVSYLRMLSKRDSSAGAPMIPPTMSGSAAGNHPGSAAGIWWHRLWNKAMRNLGMNNTDEQLSHPVSKPEKARDNYNTYCVQCHGIPGDGMGVNIKDMHVKPRNHTDSKYMMERSDTVLLRAIKGGGLAISKSPLMPPWEDTLSNREIRDLVKYIRQLCKCTYGARNTPARRLIGNNKHEGS